MMAWAVLRANGDFDWTFDFLGLLTAASTGTFGILDPERFSKPISVKGVSQNLEQEQVNVSCQDFQQHLLLRSGLLTAAVWCNSIAADKPRAIPSILSALTLLLVMILRFPTRHRIEKWVLFRLGSG